MRRFGLDELPQLANVLGGNMSLIGTRPLVGADIERNQAAAPHLFDEWYEYFRAVKPGLAGKSQVYRHHYQDTTPDVLAASMEMDLRYFDTATLRQDVRWLFATPVGMLRTNFHVVENAAELALEAAE